MQMKVEYETFAKRHLDVERTTHADLSKVSKLVRGVANNESRSRSSNVLGGMAVRPSLADGEDLEHQVILTNKGPKPHAEILPEAELISREPRHEETSAYPREQGDKIDLETILRDTEEFRT